MKVKVACKGCGENFTCEYVDCKDENLVCEKCDAPDPSPGVKE